MYQHHMDEFIQATGPRRLSLTIHVEGASLRFETILTAVWEELIHVLPAVQHLNIAFVGPDALPPQNTESHTEVTCEACPECTNSGVMRNVALSRTTYHDFVRINQHSELYQRPALAVAFNTGLYEEHTESWRQSINVLLDMNVPCVFTSFNQDEAKGDCKEIVDCGASIVSGPELNPMRCGFNSVDPTARRGGPYFFQQNMFVTCFKGRS